MAKRKRLTPANPAFLGAPVPGAAPMRAPIADVARETSATAAAEELARTLTEAREQGRMVIVVPLEAVQLDYLVRDRIAADDEDMIALKASLAARGQQTPVELVEMGGARYGLISGWRRCKALAALHSETGNARFATVAGLVRRPAERAEAYLAMVEENEIRVGLSYFERARIVVKSVEQGVFETDRAALQTLFEVASRAKRSKIGGFLPLVRAFDGALRFPHAVSERLGLQLARSLSDDPTAAQTLRAALEKASHTTPEQEVAALEAALSPVRSSAPTASAALPPEHSAPASSVSPPRATAPKSRAVKVIAGIHLSEDAQGRILLEGNRVDATFKARLLAWLRDQ